MILRRHVVSGRWASLLTWGAGLAFIGSSSNAQSVRINNGRMTPDQHFSVSISAEPSSYYVLRRGSSVTNIYQAASAKLGLEGDIDIEDSALLSNAQTVFYLVQKVPRAHPLDLDDDGIDDVYELEHPDFLSPIDRADAELDPDGDGRTHRDDYIAAVTPLTTVSETSPLNGEGGVSVTRKTVVRFSNALSADARIDTSAFRAVFGGRQFLSRVELATDRKSATLFYLEPIPGSSRITVTIDGSGLKDYLGRPLDLDGDGQPGGVAKIVFDTASTAPIADTAVIGRVFAAELIPGGTNTTTSLNHPLAGVTITVDGQEETLRTVTDVNGNFKLSPVPVGRFFVHIDGRTSPESAYPDGAYYPILGKAWEAIAGKDDNLAAGTGTIYLPLVAAETLKPVSANVDTVVSFPDSVLAKNPALEGAAIVVPANSLLSDDGTRNGKVGLAPVPSDRLPEPLPAGLRHAIDISIQTDGGTVFDRPVPVRFPNLPDPQTGQKLAPGAKSALWSFNHDTGRWEIQGSMTVTDDGKFVETDRGVGVKQPGWHGTMPGTIADGGPPPPPPPPPVCANALTANQKASAGAGTCYSSLPNACTADLDTGLLDVINRRVCSSFPFRTRLNHGNDGEHTNTSRHYSNLAVDFSGVNFKTGKRLKTNEALAIAKKIAGTDLHEVSDGFEATFKDGSGTYRVRFENPDTDNSHFHIDRIDLPAPGTRSSPLPCGCPKLKKSQTTSQQLANTPPPRAQPRPPYYVRITISGEPDIRLKTSESGNFRVILPPGKTGILSLYAPVEQLIWIKEFVTPSSGAATRITDQNESEWETTFPLQLFEESQVPAGEVDWELDSAGDSDLDGISDSAEEIVGTDPNNPDTDEDGISDGTEIQEGTDPLSDLPVRTGLISTVRTSGNAKDLSTQNGLVVIADSDAGISLFNAFNGLAPSLVAQVSTPGPALRVATSDNFAAVAEGNAGVAIIDMSDRTSPHIIHQIATADAASAVAVQNGFAYVGLASGRISQIDLSSGSVLGETSLPVGPIRDVAIEGSVLAAVGDAQIAFIPVVNGAVVVDRAGFLNSGGKRIFLANNVAYFTFSVTSFSSGFGTIDISDVRNPKLIARNQTTQGGWQQMIPNGSGLGIAAAGVTGPDDLYLYDLKDPANLSNFLTVLNTPGQANSVSIYGGLAYVADGTAGLSVMNYLAYDNRKVPPTISLAVDFSLNPPQVEEGKTVTLIANVTDDVQVRTVEFYVDGELKSTDGAFPFELTFTTPLRSSLKTTFTIKAKATDTGGNSTWTDEMTVSLQPDTTPPQFAGMLPDDGAIAGNAPALFIRFTEPVNPTTITTDNVKLIFAGSDNVLDTADDSLVPVSLEVRSAINTLVITPLSTLPSGLYRGVIGSNVKDIAGNAIGSDRIWAFWILAGGPDGDPDNDDLSNKEEVRLGTNPFIGDTDGDGWLDGVEVADGRDPLNANSRPQDLTLTFNRVIVDSLAPDGPGEGNLIAIVANRVIAEIQAADSGLSELPAMSVATPPVSIDYLSADEAESGTVTVAGPNINVELLFPDVEMEDGVLVASPPTVVTFPDFDASDVSIVLGFPPLSVTIDPTTTTSP